MNPRFIDWIWHIRGSVPLGAELSSSEAFGRLAPLFREAGTTHERMNDTLSFRKKDQAAQDKMSIFDGGVLQIERRAAGSILHYHLTSRALLFCFLAPLLFLCFAQLTIAVGNMQEPAEKPAIEKKKDVLLPQNAIDKFLGSPAPELPKAEKGEKSKGEDDKPSPKPAYVFAAIFAVLYIVGRVLEDRLVKSLFRKRLRQA